MIFIWGFMGAGKSTIGKRWAAQLQLPFVDLDTEITRNSGMSIPEIFDRYGEASFRKFESEALLKVASLPGAVVACGGGTPCFQDNLTIMHAAGISVYIEASPALLLDRLAQPSSKLRPLLPINEQEREVFVEELLQKREVYYKKADIIIEAPGAKNAAIPEVLIRLIS